MIHINNLDHADPIAQAAGVLFNMRYDHVMSRTVDGELVGGVVFNGWSPGGSVNAHMAGFRSGWATLELTRTVFQYCFNQLKVKKVFALVPSDNLKALEINRRMGFKDELVVPDVFADADLMVLSMRREQCRWLNRTTRNTEVTDGRQSISPSPA